MELAIDTSTDWAGLALSCEGIPFSELTWKPGQNHTSELFPNLENLLRNTNSEMQSLSSIFVAKGPGSYNGLRAGISAAKGLAFSLQIPLVAVSTLEIEAYPFAFAGLPVCPLQDAGRGEIATALYTADGGWRCLEPEHLTTIDILCANTEVKTVFCGEITPALMEKIKHIPGERAIIPGPCERLRRPGFLSSLGWQLIKKGHTENISTLQPIYLRQPPITQRKKKY
ncbi:MAG: tRNA (adenosine(37)-N6)-threonylcarbamoyltransferase complex dimerization subunit type 1 TsaB [Dehalococcoidia bacterium]|nr:tRNA (adenosine(37)-N6)-threonylcarbamoyltransferase complex dimerization subunit type 1 TsaB [Dehalococcoidia bacterium]